MNTKPSTPFGKFFAKIGIWRPTIEDAIKDLYENLQDKEKAAVTKASGWIAIINQHLEDAPDVVFHIIQKKFPDVNKEQVGEALNKVNAAVLKADTALPDDFATALGKLQNYLAQYRGKDTVFGVISRSVVTILSNVLLKGATPVQTIETVLEFVYRNLIKGKVVDEKSNS